MKEKKPKRRMWLSILNPSYFVIIKIYFKSIVNNIKCSKN